MHAAEACHGVLSQEAHLFSKEEKDYLTCTLDLPCKFVQSETHLPPRSSFIRLYFPPEMQIIEFDVVNFFPDDALYILVRLSLRKLKWHRQSDLESHYLPELVSKERICSACDLLSAKSGKILSPFMKPSISQSKKRSLSTKNPYSANPINIIELTLDDDKDENAQEPIGVHASSTTQIKAELDEEPQSSVGGGVQRLLLAYHAKNHSCAELHELDRKSTRLNSSHESVSRMPSSA